MQNVVFTSEACNPKYYQYLQLFQDKIENAKSEAEEVKVAMLENSNGAGEHKDVNQKAEKPQCTVSLLSVQYIKIYVISKINTSCYIYYNITIAYGCLFI